MNRRVVFYGDSNTYGYDPRGFLGMRYPAGIRWTEIVREHFGDEYEIAEEGQNGRLLPSLPREERLVEQILAGCSEGDLLFIMLGTNDILLTAHPDAGKAIRKMEVLLDWLLKMRLGPDIVVIGPVPIAETGEDMHRYFKESLRMNDGFEAACAKRRIEYHNAGEWNIPLAFAGVHFSEEGCRRFADRVIGILV